MTALSAEKLYEVIEATWPPAAKSRKAAFTIRDGQGGGKRVSAATLDGSLSVGDIRSAEDAMRALDQTPLFQIRHGEEALDEMLEAAGYQIADPVNMYAAPAEHIATELPPRTIAIPAWEPLQIMEEIWATGGIGRERINVMHRGCTPKSAFVSRWNDKPAGASFVAMHDGIAMLHALEILPEQRRNGLARWAMRRAAFWTIAQGGHTLSVICTKENDAANALYSHLGMDVIGQYHYRIKPE